MENSRIMCRVVTPYICNKCNNPTLFFLNKQNKLIDYKKLIDRQNTLESITNFLAANNVIRAKCINCNTEHYIDWSNGYPTMLSDDNVLSKFTDKI